MLWSFFFAVLILSQGLLMQAVEIGLELSPPAMALPSTIWGYGMFHHTQLWALLKEAWFFPQSNNWCLPATQSKKVEHKSTTSAPMLHKIPCTLGGSGLTAL